MGGAGFLLIILAFVFLYFVIVRPQKRRQLAQQRLLDDIKVGDEIVTAGGILGSIVKIDEQYVTVEVAPNTQMIVQRGAISQLLPKGTIKAL